MGVLVAQRASVDTSTATAAFGATASFAPTPKAQRRATFALSAATSMTAAGITIDDPSAIALLGATATFAPTGKRIARATAAFSATATLSPTPKRIPLATAAYSAASSFAATGFSQGLTTGQRRVVFYVSNDFTTSGPSPASEADIAQRLVRYVDDMNFIFAKNTNLELVYDPDTDCIFRTQAELNNPPNLAWTFPPWPEDFTEIILSAWILKRASGVSTGETCYRTGVNEIGAVWCEYAAIWSDDDIANNTSIPGTGSEGATEDYCKQLHFKMHEWGHGHGLASSEYYNTTFMYDNSGTLPDMTVINGSGGNYFTTRTDVILDPMGPLTQSVTSDISLFLQGVRFTALSASVINAFADETMPGENFQLGSAFLYPSLPQTITVEVLNAVGGAPIADAAVSIYELQDTSIQPSSETTPRETKQTNGSGITTFLWGDDEFSLTVSGNNARLFKVSKAGFLLQNEGWLSCFDLQARHIEQQGLYTQDTDSDFHYPSSKHTIRLTPL